MEPLTGFFILEGLLFDIIDAIFIISGIVFPKGVSFKPTNLDKQVLQQLNKIKFDLSIYESDVSHYTHFKNDEFTHQEFHDEATPEMTIKLNEHIVQLLVYLVEQSAEKNNNKNKVLQGLPFLIGGFLLQGIGVINQLLL